MCLGTHVHFDRNARRTTTPKRITEGFGAVPSEELRIDHIARYWHLLRGEACEKSDEGALPGDHAQINGCFIDDRTWDDLAMDAVFARLCACQTSVGDSCLYAMLREPCLDPQQRIQLEQREQLIAYLDTHPDERIEIQILLAKMGRMSHSGLEGLNFDLRALRLHNTFIYPLLACLPVVFALIFVFNPLAGLAGMVASCVLNGAIHYRLERKTEHAMTSLTYSSSLLWSTHRILKRMDRTTEGLCSHPIIESLRDSYRVFRLLRSHLSVAVRQTHWFSEVEGFRDFFDIVFLARVRHYNRAIRVVEQERVVFRQLYRSFGELDVACSVLSFRASLSAWCIPDAQDSSHAALEATDLVHPLLDHPVANTFSFAQNSLFTGSNASGKSTFIKAVGINMVLAWGIHTCVAKRFATAPLLTVTSMAVRDDLLAGESYFIVELRSLKRLLDQASSSPCLCLVDEILKGTNTIERIAASVAILGSVCDTTGLFLVATHDSELTTLLTPGFTNYHFSEQITAEGVAFDYLLKDGPTQTRNALKLLEVYDFDPEVLTQAKALAHTFEQTGAWAEE